MRTKTMLVSICAAAMVAVNFDAQGKDVVPLDAKLLHAVNMVEASGQHGIIKGYNDGGKARGGFQIHKEFWMDAVEFDKKIGGSYGDVTNKAYAEKVVTAYLNRYCRDAIIKKDYKKQAFMFHRGKDNEAYWLKVKKYLDN